MRGPDHFFPRERAKGGMRGEWFDPHAAEHRVARTTWGSTVSGNSLAWVT